MSTPAFPGENQDSPASLRVLRRFLRNPELALSENVPCELCASPLAEEHRHLLDLAQGRLLCVCAACALLFSPRETKMGKYRLIPRRYLALTEFHLTDEQWYELALPVNLVYLLRSSETGSVRAFYPGPAGATEAPLAQEDWRALLMANSILDSLEPDVEALLINRIGPERAYYIVPIDLCYRLAGLIRATWRGLSGGSEVWNAIEGFFADLRAKASPAISRSQAAHRVDEDISLPAQEARKGGADERA